MIVHRWMMVIALSTAATTSCFEESFVAGATVSCATDDHCREGERCIEQRCADAATLPAVAVLQSAAVEPALVRTGDIIEVTLTYNQVIDTAPRLVLGATQQLPMPLADANGATYRYAQEVNAAVPEGTHALVVTTLELGQSLSRQVGEVVVDKTGPLLLSSLPLRIASSLPSLSLRFDEALGAVPRVELRRDDTVVSVAVEQQSDDAVTTVVTPLPANIGAWSLRVVAVDAAGNERITNSSLVADAAPPTLNSYVASKTRANSGSVVELSVVASEPLLSAPSLNLLGQPQPCALVSDQQVSCLVLVPDAVDDVVDYQFDDITDLANNTSSQVFAEALVVDNTPPSSDIVLVSSTLSHVAPHRVLVAEAQAVSDLEAMTASAEGCQASCDAQRCSLDVVACDIRGLSLLVVERVDQAGNRHRNELPFFVDVDAPVIGIDVPSIVTGRVRGQLSSNEALAEIQVMAVSGDDEVLATIDGSNFDVDVSAFAQFSLVVRASDAVGNVAALETTVIRVDSQAPQLTTPQEVRAQPARPVALLLVFDEPLFAVPTVRVDQGGPSATFPCVVSDVRVQCLVTSTVDADLVLDGVVDAVGNRVDDLRVGTIRIDSVAPELQAVRASRSVYSLHRPFNNVEVTYDTDAGAIVTASFGAAAMTCGAGVCSLPLAAGNVSAGNAAIIVAARDDVGNTTERFVSVVVDRDAPRLLGHQVKLDAKLTNPLPRFLTAGQTGQVLVEIDEPVLSTAHAVVVSSTTSSTLDLALNNQRTTAAGTHELVFDVVVDRSLDAGQYHVELAVTDNVGNDAQVVLTNVFTVDQTADSDCHGFGVDGSIACSDADGDGLLAPLRGCAQPFDCNDNRADVFPLAVEIPGDGVDNDCLGDGDSPITDDNTVFVSPTGAAAAAGTRADPLRSLAEAATRAGFDKFIAMKAGAYVETVTSNVQRGLLGGLNDDWQTGGGITHLTFNLPGSGNAMDFSNRSPVNTAVKPNFMKDVKVTTSCRGLVVFGTQSTFVDVEIEHVLPGSCGSNRDSQLSQGNAMLLRFRTNGGVSTSASQRYVDSRIETTTNFFTFSHVGVNGQLVLVRTLVSGGRMSASFGVNLRAVSSVFDGRRNSSDVPMQLTDPGRVVFDFSTVYGGDAAFLVGNTNVQSVGSLFSGATSARMQSPARLSSEHSLYERTNENGCAIQEGFGACLAATQAELDACNSSYCDLSDGDLIAINAVDENGALLPGSPFADIIDDPGLVPTDAIRDFNGTCRGPTDLAMGAFEP
jgi:hypothetical protein